MKDGKTRWEDIRRLQQAHAERRPIMPSAVRKEDGKLTQMLQRWHQHFSRILNQQSEFSEEVIQQMPILPPCLSLDEPPTKKELVSKVEMRKVGGKTCTGILPEMVLLRRWRSSVGQGAGADMGHLE